ncbi:unnamed protein product [Adineta steineri]|uniref:Ig-like domain-containing protein n=1 Tax=Adineta steineri TaxID=433720 RepID=A0A814GGY4_9BILA|nr:unnamed protein product [Adineta steineri]CAF3768427.1 unnamed protein product [Adineta steineri]
MATGGNIQILPPSSICHLFARVLAKEHSDVKDANASTTVSEFLKEIKNAEGNEGKTIILECEVIGTPKHDVEWFKGIKEISQGAKYTITRDGDKCIFFINNATSDDVDEYSIKARNQRGSRMCRCNVNIRLPSRFRLPPKYQDVLNYDKDESIVIKIPYTGSPLPNVMLSDDENNITKNKNVSIDASDRFITLTIQNGDKNTTGPYKIKLGNNLGEDEVTLSIHVSDVPGIPQNVQVDSVFDESVELS